MGQNLSAEVFKPPDPPTYDHTLSNLLWIEREGRRIPGVFIRWESSDGKGTEVTILYFIDTTTDMGVFQKWLRIMSTVLKANVLVFDYYGYGLNSTGAVPGERTCFEDSEYVFDYLVTDLKIPPSCVILFGRSTGSGPLFHLYGALKDPRKSLLKKRKSQKIPQRPNPRPAASPTPRKQRFGTFSSKKDIRRDSKAKLGDEGEGDGPSCCVAGVVVQSAMTSVLDVLPSGSWKVLTTDIFENLKRAHHVDVPVLIVHGKCDDVVPLHHARRLMAKLPHVYSVLEMDDAGHHDIETDYSDDLLDSMIVFLRDLFVAGDEPPPAKPAPPPTRFVGPPIVGWLASHGLSKYQSEFISMGYTDPVYLTSITVDDLTDMGIGEESDKQQILRILGLEGRSDAVSTGDDACDTGVEQKVGMDSDDAAPHAGDKNDTDRETRGRATDGSDDERDEGRAGEADDGGEKDVESAASGRDVPTDTADKPDDVRVRRVNIIDTKPAEAEDDDSPRHPHLSSLTSPSTDNIRRTGRASLRRTASKPRNRMVGGEMDVQLKENLMYNYSRISLKMMAFNSSHAESDKRKKDDSRPSTARAAPPAAFKSLDEFHRSEEFIRSLRPVVVEDPHGMYLDIPGTGARSARTAPHSAFKSLDEFHQSEEFIKSQQPVVMSADHGLFLETPSLAPYYHAATSSPPPVAASPPLAAALPPIHTSASSLTLSSGGPLLPLSQSEPIQLPITSPRISPPPGLDVPPGILSSTHSMATPPHRPFGHAGTADVPQASRPALLFPTKTRPHPPNRRPQLHRRIPACHGI